MVLKTLIIASVLAIAAGAAPAAADDDPAIAVCEQATRAELPRDALYDRQSARIQGKVVIVNYKVTLAGGGTQDTSKLCEYRLDRRQAAYVIKAYRRVYSVDKTCDGAAAMFRDPMPADERAVEKRILEIADCLSDARDRVQLLNHYLSVASRTGLYPIQSGDTALR